MLSHTYLSSLKKLFSLSLVCRASSSTERQTEEKDQVLGLEDLKPDRIDVVGLGFEAVGFNGQ